MFMLVLDIDQADSDVAADDAFDYILDVIRFSSSTSLQQQTGHQMVIAV